MAGEPKRRHSRQRKGKRRASIKLAVPNAVVCANCSEMMIGHSVCKNCGYYQGREVINKTKTSKTSQAQAETA